MPRYKVLELSYIDGSLRQPGDVVLVDGPAGTNLQPLDPVKSSNLPPVAQTLVQLARQRAATRGDSPDNANDGDVDSVVADGFNATDKAVSSAKAELVKTSSGVNIA